jgi:hypothetical protein
MKRNSVKMEPVCQHEMHNKNFVGLDGVALPFSDFVSERCLYIVM